MQHAILTSCRPCSPSHKIMQVFAGPHTTLCRSLQVLIQNHAGPCIGPHTKSCRSLYRSSHNIMQVLASSIQKQHEQQKLYKERHCSVHTATHTLNHTVHSTAAVRETAKYCLNTHYPTLIKMWQHSKDIYNMQQCNYNSDKVPVLVVDLPSRHETHTHTKCYKS